MTHLYESSYESLLFSTNVNLPIFIPLVPIGGEIFVQYSSKLLIGQNIRLLDGNFSFNLDS